jgi:transposase-like protein
MKSSSRARQALPSRSAFSGCRFPAEVIAAAVRWYLRFCLSYRDMEELLAERGVEVEHGTAYRWGQRFTPLLADAARFARHSPGDQWFVDELAPAAWHHVERGANRIEGDHGRLKHRLRPMRGLRSDRTVQVIAGLAFVQNLRRGHYELATDVPHPPRIAAAFTELASAI